MAKYRETAIAGKNYDAAISAANRGMCRTALNKFFEGSVSYGVYLETAEEKAIENARMLDEMADDAKDAILSNCVQSGKLSGLSRRRRKRSKR